MDIGWTIDLLPTRGLDQSILIAVLVGMWIMLFFTETFGWVFIGVVVPGYLSSVIIIQPTTALAIFVEAIISLYLSRWIALTLGKTGAWTQFFGRDRFFIIVLVSVIVRQLDQTWLLPALGQWMEANHLPKLNLDDDFSSIGLVLVPLTANMFWKLSVTRGLVQFSVVVGLTYAVLRWILLPYTNLSYSSFELTYENSAIDFVANAKSYIIMLFTAYLAGVVNLRYGWDFGGILVAALLGLLWWTPTKLALTILESVLLLWATQGLLKLPVIRSFNLEGSRKVATVFSLAFFLKWLVGLAIGDAFPGLKVTDLFAFGYLMSSLLAARMLVKKSIRLVLLPALLTSGLGFVLASLLGLALQALSEQAAGSVKPTANVSVVSKRLLRTPEGVLGYVTARRSIERASDTAPSELQSIRQIRIWDFIGSWLHSRRSEVPDGVLQQLVEADLYWSRLEPWVPKRRDGDELLVDSEDRRDTYLIHPGEREDGSPFEGPIALLRPGATGPFMVVQWPQRWPGLAETAWQECIRLDCALLMTIEASGAQRRAKLAPSPSASAQSIMRLLRRNAPLWHVVATDDLPSGERRLHLDSSQSESAAFQRADLTLDWAQAPEATRVAALRSDRVLRIPSKDLRSIVAHSPQNIPVHDVDQSFSEFIETIKTQIDLRREHLSPGHLALAQRISYSSTELRFLENIVATPLLTEADSARMRRSRLESIAWWAGLLDFEVFRLSKCDGGDGCLGLVLLESEQALIWLIRVGGSGNVHVEIPRPRLELGVLGFGESLWSAFHLRSLLVHVGHPQFDPTFAGETHTVFQSIHQALDAHVSRASGGFDNLIFQTRGFGVQSEESSDKLVKDETSEALDAQQEIEGTDLIFGIGLPILQYQQIPEALLPWMRETGMLNFLHHQRVSDGSLAMHGYAASTVPQIRYSRVLGGSTPVALWLSPRARENYRDRHSEVWKELRRNALALRDRSVTSGPWTGIPELPVIDERAFLTRFADPGAWTLRDSDIDSATAQWGQILSDAEQVAEFGHPQAFMGLWNWGLRSTGHHVDVVRGKNSGLPYLSIRWEFRGQCLRALVLLGDANDERIVVAPFEPEMQGPFLSVPLAQLERVRTIVGSGCEAPP